MKRGQIFHGGVLWAERAECAASPLKRMRGLLGRRSLGPGAALVIERCNAVHTVGMRFVIDLVFLDRGWRVTCVVRDVRPGRLMVWGGWRSARVIESEAGCLDVDALRLCEELTFVCGTAD
ncbi:MAG TPA: DUF192 domain-containing protein [Kiritimatiellia bacterium]|nr:DUF192 domain-containing protein [Kiritimatiellia bacterium]HPS07261.1 DUF192 domain-containing protein [Kiritimatiellia bacterium]